MSKGEATLEEEHTEEHPAGCAGSQQLCVSVWAVKVVAPGLVSQGHLIASGAAGCQASTCGLAHRAFIPVGDALLCAGGVLKRPVLVGCQPLLVSAQVCPQWVLALCIILEVPAPLWSGEGSQAVWVFKGCVHSL